MILTVVPNPSLDKTVVIPDFGVGQIYRVEVLTLAGGKGFNFARVLQTLGSRSLLVGPIGGYAGRRLLNLAAEDGLECDGLQVNAELRTCLTIIDPNAGNRPTEVYEKGAPLKPGDWDALVELTASHFSPATFLAVCGSFPPGTPADGLHNLLRRATSAGLPILLDTYGPQLTNVLAMGPALLKVNQHEAGSIVKRAITTGADALAVAEELQRRGVREVVITLGKDGAVGRTAEGETFGWAAPNVAAICPTGSGDSLFAGIVAGLERKQCLPEATRLGVAAGAANTLRIGAGRLSLHDVERLLPEVQALPIA